jgi:hypothetical protein
VQATLPAAPLEVLLISCAHSLQKRLRFNRGHSIIINNQICCFPHFVSFMFIFSLRSIGYLRFLLLLLLLLLLLSLQLTFSASALLFHELRLLLTCQYCLLPSVSLTSYVLVTANARYYGLNHPSIFTIE